MRFRKLHKIRKLRQNLAIALISTILFFLSVEVCLTIVGFNVGSTSAIVDPQMRFFGAKAGRGLPKEKRRCLRDPLLFWRLKPRPEEVNSAGFRSKKEYSLNKEKGVYRIICLGDSVTYGVWVKTEETYPSLLEQMLNASSDSSRFEVINAGVMGYSSLQGLRQLKRDLLIYKPDLITVLFGFDDNHPAIVFSDKEQRVYNKYIFALQNILRNSRFYCLLEISLRRIMNRLFSGGDNLSLVASDQIKRRVEPEDYRRNLQEMVKITEANNFEILFLSPIVFKLRTKEISYLRDYANITPQAHTINMLEAFRNNSEKGDHLFLDGCHFTPQGHWVVAKEVYGALVKKKIVNPKNVTVNIPMPAYSKDSLPAEIKENNLRTYIKMGENEIGALGFGWHDLEKIGDRYARFTGFHANAFLKNSSLGVKEKKLRIEMFSYISTKAMIFVNNNYFAEVECLPNLWQETELKFQDNTRFLKISIAPERIFKPSIEFGSRDDRTLGVAISKIEIVENM